MVTTAPPESEDASVQVEVALSVRTRHLKPTTGAQGVPPALSWSPRIPRITRLMALAIKFQEMVDRGEVRDYADLARLGYVTRARLTQIMNLLLLAPDIQEEILAQQLIETGIATISERQLRHLVLYPTWQRQRSAWTALKSRWHRATPDGSLDRNCNTSAALPNGPPPPADSPRRPRSACG